MGNLGCGEEVKTEWLPSDSNNTATCFSARKKLELHSGKAVSWRPMFGLRTTPQPPSPGSAACRQLGLARGLPQP